MEFLICSHDKAAANQLGEIISGKYPSCGISYLTTSDLSNKVNTSRADVVFIDGDSDKKNAAVFGAYIQRKNPEAMNLANEYLKNISIPEHYLY